MIRRLVPVLRRCVQGVSLLVLVLLPLLALYTHYKEAHAIHDLGEKNWRNVAVRAIDGWVNQHDSRKRMVEQSQGTIWSARLAGVSVSDPLAGAEAILSSRTLYAPMLWSLLIPLGVSLLLGRIFCGWICPMNTMLEVVDRARRFLRIAEIRERDVRFSLRNKYLVLAVVLGLVASTGVPFIALFYPPAVLSREMHVYIFGATIGVGTYVILAICVFELLVSKRWWCRYICPGGALYSLLGRYRVVRVAREMQNCIQCGECVRVCQFDLRPMLVQITGMECTNCGSCVRACNDDALRFKLVLPRRRSASTLPVIDAPDTKLRRSTAVLLIVIATWLAPTPARAHHILGLPHYSYKENYPQAPTLEYPATTGPFDVLMTSFPGRPVPGDRTTIAFYIKHRESGRPYDLPVSLRVLKTATFGRNQVIMDATIHEPTTNQHKYFVEFPEAGEYVAELTMEVEGKAEVIPFLIVAGEPTATTSILLATVAGLGSFLLVVRAVKRKRDRRRPVQNEKGPASCVPC